MSYYSDKQISKRIWEAFVLSVNCCTVSSVWFSSVPHFSTHSAVSNSKLYNLRDWNRVI